MSADLRTRLRETAAVPTRPVNLDAIGTGIRRRRRVRRGSAVLAAGAACAAIAVVATGLGRVTVPTIHDVAGASDRPTTTTSAAPSDTTPSAAADAEAVHRRQELKAERTRLIEVEADLNRQRVELLATRAQLRARQDDGEDVAAELQAADRALDQLRVRLEDVARQRFAVEAQLVEIGVLDDPVATARAAATDADRATASALIAFAADPSSASFDALPLAPMVSLGLGDTIRDTVDRAALDDPARWVLTAEAFRAHTGPFSALRLLAGADDVQVLAGPHPHCASPPVPAPSGFETLRRVSIQPVSTSSCLDWWTVDLYLDDGGDIAAVTLDLWEP